MAASSASLVINSSFDGGSIECVECCEDAANVRLRLLPDPVSLNEGGKIFRQHFDFTCSKISPAEELPRDVICFRIENARASMCGYESYTAMYSLDGSEDWKRCDETGTTQIDEEGDGALVLSVNVVRHSPDSPGGGDIPGGGDSPDGRSSSSSSRKKRVCTVHVAYFVPYRYDTQHADLIARCLQSPLVTRSCAGLSVEKREIDLLTITDRSTPPEGKMAVWIVCRQHPAETMAEWWADGFLGRLLDGDPLKGADPARDALLRGSVVNIICCANPDGAALGLTRTNAAGMNLNREWSTPTEEHTPEIVGILAKIAESPSSSCDFVLDVHGDETLPRPVLCCAPAWDARLDRLQRAFWAELASANSDFSLEDSLPHLIHIPPAPGDAAGQCKTGADRLDNMAETGANLTLCSTQLAFRHDCLAMTLEQCFLAPWSVEKSKQLGADMIQPLAAILPSLRS